MAAASWYTFRFFNRDEGSQVRVDFELADPSGVVLVSAESLPPMELQGPQAVPFTRAIETAAYGSGHVWFLDLAAGLDRPIDEHRVAPM